MIQMFAKIFHQYLIPICVISICFEFIRIRAYQAQKPIHGACNELECRQLKSKLTPAWITAVIWVGSFFNCIYLAMFYCGYYQVGIFFLAFAFFGNRLFPTPASCFQSAIDTVSAAQEKLLANGGSAKSTEYTKLLRIKSLLKENLDKKTKKI